MDQKQIDNIGHDKHASLSLLYPPFRELLTQGINECRSRGLDIYPFETWRGAARQGELYAQGRTTSGKIVTNAHPFESAHQYGLAVDLVFGGPGRWSWTGDYKGVAEVMERLGLVWAGRWKKPESPHFQMLYGMSLADAKAIHTTQGILGVWAYVENLKQPHL